MTPHYTFTACKLKCSVIVGVRSLQTESFFGNSRSVCKNLFGKTSKYCFLNSDLFESYDRSVNQLD